MNENISSPRLTAKLDLLHGSAVESDAVSLRAADLTRGGQVIVDIRYPEGSPQGVVTGAEVTNHDNGIVFHTAVRPMQAMRPGETLSVGIDVPAVSSSGTDPGVVFYSETGPEVALEDARTAVMAASGLGDHREMRLIAASASDDTSITLGTLRALVEMAGRAEVTEYALVAAGGWHLRPNEPAVERAYPLGQWIEDKTANGARVVRRTVIVVRDWEKVTGAEQ